MASFDGDEFTILKKAANENFANGKFNLAEAQYTELLDKFPQNERSIIFTNRSAARFSQDNFEASLEDANSAIEIDNKWLKAYYRKASALEKLGKPKESFDVWVEACEKCDASTSPWLSEKVVKARENWIKIFRDVPVVSEKDLSDRYDLLHESRDKLSTLVHFWNGRWCFVL